MAKKYSKTKLKVFRNSIEKRMKEIATDMDDLHDGILDKSSTGGGLSQESVYSVHMADAGTDSFEQEKNYNLMSRESDYFKNETLTVNMIDEFQSGEYEESFEIKGTSIKIGINRI